MSRPPSALRSRVVRRVRGAALAAAALLAAGCVSSTVAVSRAGACAGTTPLPRVVSTLYLGRAARDGAVDDAAWRRFVAEVVAPRFPDGFTVLDGEGWWRAAGGAAASEPSKVLVRLHDGSAAADAAVGAVAGEYARRFHQEAVLRVDTPACAGFAP
jgi:hypothetical protein